MLEVVAPVQVSVVVPGQVSVRASVVVPVQVSILAIVQVARRETMIEGLAGTAWTQVPRRSKVKESIPEVVASSQW